MINLYLCTQTINNTMKRNLLLLSSILFLCVCGTLQAIASDTVFVRETQIPILIERQDNVLFMLRLNAKESRSLDEVVLNFGKDVNLADYSPLSYIIVVRKPDRTTVRISLLLYLIFPAIRRERHWLRILLIRLISRKWIIRNRKLH